MRGAVLLVLAASVLCIVRADDSRDFAISIFSSVDVKNSECQVGTVGDSMSFIFVSGIGTCLSMQYNGSTLHYSLELGETPGSVTGKIFCQDTLCTKCAATFTNLYWQQCISAIVNGSVISAALQLASTPCIGGALTPEYGLLIIEYQGSPACSIESSQNMIITNVAETDRNCASTPFWYNLTMNEDHTYTESLDCDFYCSNCGVVSTSASILECIPSSVTASSWQLYRAADFDQCTFMPSNKSDKLSIAIGASLGAVLLALLVAIPVRKCIFNKRVAYIAIPQIQIS